MSLDAGEMLSETWDGAKWRDLRNAKLMEWLQDPLAVQYVMNLSHFVEIVDDFVDQDKPVSKEDLSHALFSALYHIPANPFFQANKTMLLPITFTCINAWMDSNDLASGDETEKALAFTLKGLGVEALLTCIAITRGVEYLRTVSADVRRLLMAHQTFADYCKETHRVV